MSGLKPRPRSSRTLFCVGFVFCSPVESGWEIQKQFQSTYQVSNWTITMLNLELLVLVSPEFKNSQTVTCLPIHTGCSLAIRDQRIILLNSVHSLKELHSFITILLLLYTILLLLLQFSMKTLYNQSFLGTRRFPNNCMFYQTSLLLMV